VADVPAARKVIYRGTFTEGRHATECAYLSESTIAQRIMSLRSLFKDLFKKEQQSMNM
jgi:hypothetical protein